MKKVALVLLALSLASSAYAAKKPCPCRHTHPVARPCSTTAAKPCSTSTTSAAAGYGIYDQVVDGFSVTGGFRWDRACPSNSALVTTPPPIHSGNVDPFFIGIEERLPLNSALEIGGNLDRDFTDSPHWSARVFVAAHPWRK